MNNHSNYNRYLEHTGRSQGMERLSRILGLASICCFFILYISVPCGALAVIFAVLSKGSTNSMTRRAQISMILGLVGLSLSVCLNVMAFLALYQQYGSIEEIIRQMYALYGLTY